MIFSSDCMILQISLLKEKISEQAAATQFPTSRHQLLYLKFSKKQGG